MTTIISIKGKHVKSESFFARDNVAQFIRLRCLNNQKIVKLYGKLDFKKYKKTPLTHSWCRGELGISDTIMFETEDLVLRKNEKNFILTLLEVRTTIQLIAPLNDLYFKIYVIDLFFQNLH